MSLKAAVRAYRRAARMSEHMDIEYRAQALYNSLHCAGLNRSARNMEEVLRSLEWEIPVAEQEL